jgi:hypothetical protein
MAGNAARCVCTHNAGHQEDMIRGSFENLHNDFNEIGVRGFILSGAPFEKFVKNQLIGSLSRIGTRTRYA